MPNRVLLAALAVLMLRAPPAVAGPGQIYFHDMTALHALDLRDAAQARTAWDTAHLVASVQGIVNRDAPRLFVRFMPQPDDFWWEELRKEGRWLSGAPVVRIDSIEKLLATFADRIEGVVVYDESTPASSNVASTVAGVENRVCVRHDDSPGSVYSRVMRTTAGRKDVLRLRDLLAPQGDGSSPKADAYLWAKQRYLDAGKCSKEYLAYYIDAYWLKRPTQSSLPNFTLANHDFFISQRAFFFDLGMWEEESPVDEPGQRPGTDVAVLRKVLRSAYERAGGKILHIGGFVPWAWKYTDHPGAGGRHGPVDSEWKYAQIISSYNGVMDADAIGLSGMANASFYQHFPLKEHYPQNRRPTVEDLKRRGLVLAGGTVAPRSYVLFYMGDYDSAAWLNAHVPTWWSDPARGRIPCAWAFNPNLDRRAPHAMDYARRHATANDWFIAGDSGAGYLNPGMLLRPRLDPDLPDGLSAWVEHNRAYYRRYDLSITGFVIDGRSRAMGDAGLDAYLQFSPDGLIGQRLPPRGVHRGTMPFLRMSLDLDGTPEQAGAKIAGMAGINLPKFAALRTILKSPTWHERTMRKARSATDGVEFVDPHTFFLLIKTHESQKSVAPARLTAPAPTRVSFADHQSHGLAPVGVDDGPVLRTTIDGAPVLRQARASGVQYLYLEVNDHWAAALRDHAGAAVTAKVTLLDRGGRVGLEFDSQRVDAGPVEGAYASAGFKDLADTGQWVTLTFRLPSPRFAHRQNGNADFRLVNLGAELLIRRVELSPEP